MVKPLLTITIPGIPSSYSTPKEKPWKESLKAFLPSALDMDVAATGLVVNFRVSGPQSGRLAVDLDNLCEPLFSVLVNQKGWFGKKRSNIQWFKATKVYEEPFGCDLVLMESLPPLPLSEQKVAFSELYQDAFPKSAKDELFFNWVQTRCEDKRIEGNVSVKLRFGPVAINIGDIGTGYVKHIIDCLHPLIGGDGKAPHDWKVRQLQVEKNASDLPANTVHVQVSEL